MKADGAVAVVVAPDNSRHLQDVMRERAARDYTVNPKAVAFFTFSDFKRIIEAAGESLSGAQRIAEKILQRTGQLGAFVAGAAAAAIIGLVVTFAAGAAGLPI